MSRKVVFIFPDANIKPINCSLSFMPAIGHIFEWDTMILDIVEEKFFQYKELDYVIFKVDRLITRVRPFQNMETEIMLTYVE